MGNELPPAPAPTMPQAMRAFLAALALTGSRLKAAAAAGVNVKTAREWRTAHPPFVELEKQAMLDAAERLRDEAIRRGRDGMAEPQYNRDGVPLYHPTDCRCGHDDETHVPDSEGPCAGAGCDCAKFRPAPYFKHTYSDKLLELLLKAALPDEFAERRQVEIKGLLAKVDVNQLLDQLPGDALAALARGEPLGVVLATMTEEALRRAFDPPDAAPLLLPGGGEVGVKGDGGDA